MEHTATRFHPGWEAAQALGVVAATCCLLLCLIAVRPRIPWMRTLSLKRHELIGWMALAAALMHVSLLLGFDQRVFEHLKPTAPIYEWLGILALILLLALTALSLPSVRQRLYAQHRKFQFVHIGMTCGLIAAVAIHIVTTGRYFHGHIGAAIFVLVSVLALSALLRARARPESENRAPGFVSSLAFGRYSRLVVAFVILAAIVTLSLMIPRAQLTLREPMLRRAAALTIDFPHDKHREVNCIECHHNFTDRTGSDACISCHRSRRPAILVGAEARFHDFCLGCHREPPARFEHHGPTTGCETCHVPAGVPQTDHF
jgi:Ferric reductase like transmembrane component/Class III cytochrome C family